MTDGIRNRSAFVSARIESSELVLMSTTHYVLGVQQHAEPEGDAVIKARTVVFKKDELTKKAWIRCNRGRKSEKNSKTTHKHITSSRLAG